MKFSELKSKFKNKYVIRVVAGVLCIAVLGTGYGTYKVSAAKVSSEDVTEEAVEETETTEEASEESDDDEVEDAIGDILDDVKADSEKEAGKEETVYLISDANGTVNTTIVSDWLKNTEGTDVLEDASDLKDIENVKGDEKFTQSGDKLTWQADGNDIFYQGTTTKEAPVSEKITYYLDGKEMAPKDIAGKSGKVTIRFDYTNHEKTKATIDGKEEEIYVPFTVVTGMVLDDSYKNVEVTNGKLISDGKNNAVVGIAMPGLKESLNVDEDDFDGDVEIPDYVEVTADVENFSLEMTMSVIMNGLQTASVDNMDLTDLDDALETLTDSSSQLVDGSGALSDGAKTLADAIGEYTDGTKTLADGIGTLANSAPTLTDGVSTLANGTQSLANGTQSLLTGAQSLASGISSARQGADTLNSSVQAMATGVPQMMSSLSTQAQNYAAQGANVGADTQAVQAAMASYTQSVTVAVAQNPSDPAAAAASVDPSGVMAAIGQLSNDAGAQGAAAALNEVSAQLANGGLTTDNINALAAGVSSLDSGLQQLDSGAANLVAGASQVNDGANQVNSGAGQLNSGAGQLKDGVDQLQNGAQKLVSNNEDLKSGASDLKDGAKELADGMEEFDTEGIKKIADAYNGDVKELLDRLDAVLDAGSDYQIFSQVKDGTNGAVKFIIKTDSVKVDDEEEK